MRYLLMRSKLGVVHASASTGTAKIQAAAYYVSVTATQGETPLTPTEENGSTVFTLEANKEYQVEIKPTGNATTGYCKVNFENKDCYTVQLPSDKLFLYGIRKRERFADHHPRMGHLRCRR